MLFSRMSTPKNLELGFSIRLYSLEYEPKLTKSINYQSKTSVLDDVKLSVGNDVWDYIRASPLGILVEFVELDFN
ncbi:unnamed protein product [Cochlearia groenlandica]